MLYKIGRILQVLGMMILPVAMAGNMVDPAHFGLWYTLSLSGVGILIFTMGWMLQQATPPDG